MSEKKRKQYTEEHKREAVGLVKEQGESGCHKEVEIWIVTYSDPFLVNGVFFGGKFSY